MWSSYALILLLKIYLGREQWCPSDKKYVNRHTLNCHIVLAIYQRCNSYSATCVSYQLALNSYIRRYRLKPVFKLVLFYHQFIYFSEYIYIWILYWPNPVTAQIRVTSVSHVFDTVMTNLVEFLTNPFYGSLVVPYHGALALNLALFVAYFIQCSTSVLNA